MRHRESGAELPALLLPLLFPLVLGTTACATGGAGEAGEGGGEPQVTIEVRNNLVPPITVSILAAPLARPLDFLGTVASQSTGTFTLRTRLIPGRFRLVAERTDGTVLVSREIQIVSDGSRVQWNLELDTVVVDEPEGEG